jgi:hypothetical protein
MKRIHPVLRSPHVRQFVVAVAVTGAGAAVAGAVVLAERPARVEPAALRIAAEPLDAGVTAAIGGHAATRSPKDAWRRLPPPWSHERALRAASADPSLPAAADVVGAAPERDDDAPSTL